MDTSGWCFVLTGFWMAGLVPVVSAEQVCYTSFGNTICKDTLPWGARFAIWAVCASILVMVIVGIILLQRHRARRERDAIATVEANQVEGPPHTAFGSSFVQVQGPPPYPTTTYNVAPYGPRTAGVAPPSAYTINFTPRTPGGPPPTKTPYASSHYPKTAELTPYDLRSFTKSPAPGAGLPLSPRPRTPDIHQPTPRDKNTRFIIPDLPRRESKRDWSDRLEALKSAPIKRNTFESLPSSEPMTQTKSAAVTGSFPKLKPLLTGTGRSKEYM